jgi:glutamate/aspartate transport system substrate-binding protein
MDDVLLYGLRATAGRPADYAVVGDPLTVEPYAVMFSKNDAELKRILDAEMARIILSGEINMLYKKWFNSPIPPNGKNLNMPMNSLLRSSFQFPSDKVADQF